jgi:alanyl-tRNA synthetase
VTGVGALGYLRRLESDLGRAAAALRRSASEVPAAVDKLVGDLRAKDREIVELQKKLASGGGATSSVQTVNGVKVLAHRTDVGDPKALREAGDRLRDSIGSGVVVLAGVADGKVSLLALVTKDLTGRFHAGKIVGAVAEVVGGRGGGRPDMAQAGGNDPAKVDAALAKVYELIRAG